MAVIEPRSRLKRFVPDSLRPSCRKIHVSVACRAGESPHARSAYRTSFNAGSYAPISRRARIVLSFGGGGSSEGVASALGEITRGAARRPFIGTADSRP